MNENTPTSTIDTEKDSDTPVATNNNTNNWNQVNKKLETITEQNQTQNTTKTEDFLKELSNKFVEQQEQIINFRSRLVRWFAFITASQLLVIDVLIFFAFFSTQGTMALLLNFLKYFIGATFIELLGGLIIIVKFVFSRETSDMIKYLTYVEPKTKKNN